MLLTSTAKKKTLSADYSRVLAFLRVELRAFLSSGLLSRVRKVRSCQEGEVNTSNLADPMIMAIITSRRKKRANAYNFRKWRPRLSLIQLFVADFSNHSSLKWYCIWISRSNYHFSFLRGK